MATVPGLNLEVHLRGSCDFGTKYVRGLMDDNNRLARGNGWAVYSDALGYVTSALNETPNPDWTQVKLKLRDSYNWREFDWRVVLSTGEVVVDLVGGN